MRVIIVNDGTDIIEMPFDSEKVSDSKALHHILCYINPGDEYTVTFKNADSANTEVAESYGIPSLNTVTTRF